jgi:hypothetical protein
MSKRVLTLVLALTVFLGAPRAADKEPEPGFTPLFNGKDLDGWHVMNKGQFSVKDGVLFLTKGGGWLRSDKEYKDFELRLDFRFLHAKANSGIFFRASKEGSNYPSKNYQVQTMDDPSLASLYKGGLPAKNDKKDKEALQKVQKPAGKWQSYDITVQGPRVEVKLNGTVITTAEGLADVAGYVGIQGEGGQLEFKNIRIKELKGDK